MLSFHNGQNSFDKAYADYSDMLYRIALTHLCSPEDAEDAVHDAFVKYIRSPISFVDESHKRAWLIRVTVNRCKDMLRKRSIRDHLPLDEAYNIANNTESVDVVLLMSQLDEKYRLALALHYLEGFSVDETAKILSLSVSATKMRLMRARQMLQQIIEKENGNG